jgi:hypothetical protein
MEKQFDDMDRRADEGCPHTEVGETPQRETFEDGATRDAVNYRYDLMSPIIAELCLNSSCPLAKYLLTLRDYKDVNIVTLWDRLTKTLMCTSFDIVHYYAKALHEGANKYGERNWEKGIPESNLINHALYHLFKVAEGDTSEDHVSHLVWNIITIIHFRETQS